MFPSKLVSDKSASAVLRVVFYRQASTSVQHSPGQQYGLQLPAPQGVKTTKLANGLVVSTVDNYNPVTRISLVFRAGSRYESSTKRGIVHRLRNLIGLSTNRRSAVDFNYFLSTSGAILTANASRDHLSYDIQIHRRNLVNGFRILDELFTEPFHANAHELEASKSQMLREIADLKETNWPGYTLDKLHKVAYRRHGLANSILSPKYAVGSHSVDDLSHFAQEHLVTGNASLAVTSVDNDDLVKWATDIFTLKHGQASAAQEKAKFNAGDMRKPTKSDLSVVHIGAPSVGLEDARATLTYTVLANLLGTGPVIKWSDGGQTRLAKAAKKATSNPFHISASNIGYEGSGLFTLHYSCSWADSNAIAKAAIGELKSIASQGVKDEELQAAKNRIKYRLLSLSEDEDYVVEDLASQAAIRQSNICQSKDQLKLVDAVTVGDLQQAAKTMASGKFAMASTGRLDKTPYSDELSS